MKALVGAFNQEKALVGAFSVIVQPVVEPMDHYTALTLMPHSRNTSSPEQGQGNKLYIRVSKEVSRRLHNHREVPYYLLHTKAFSWLKAPSSTVTIC